MTITKTEAVESTSTRTRTLSRTLGRVAEALCTPLVPADYLDIVAPMRPGARRAKVVAVRPETARATTLVLRPAFRWPGHRPGQYLRLGVDVDGVRLWRSYSLTGPQRPDGTLTVTVGALDGGAVSSYLQSVRVGALVEVDGPDGVFTLPDVAPAKTLFVTAGTGLTPVVGMLRTRLADLRDVVLVHSARTADDVMFAEELRDWAAQGRLRLVERHTATQGRLTAAALADLVPDVAERETWACGPNGLLDEIAAAAEAHGWTQRLHTERFRPVLVEPGTGGTVTYGRAGVTLEADGATTLLAAGEAGGVLLPSGCRMGICFQCVVPLTEGSVRDVRNGVVTTATAEDPALVQTCISAAAGPCALDV